MSCCVPGPAGTSTPVPPDVVGLSGESPTRTRVILLGSAAGPFPSPGRQGCSSLVVVGDRAYLVDAGYGTLRTFVQTGLPLTSLAAVFVTHLHSDHTADLFNLFLLGWGPENDGIYHPVQVYGPGDPGALPEPAAGVDPAPLVSPEHPTPGTAELLRTQAAANAYDLNIRTRYNGRRGLTSLIEPHDLLPPASTGAGPAGPFAPAMEPFAVYEDDRVRVTATLAMHPPVYPSYAFRFETDDGVIAFSGDTARCENVERLAAGADLLVHETMHVDHYRRAGYRPELLEFFRHSHTPPQEVGRVAAAAGVRRVALSHIGPADPREVTDDDWRGAVSSTFDGEVVVGHDLLQLAVPRPSPARRHKEL